MEDKEMNNNADVFIIFDLEYTWREDNPHFYEKEIIQFAALKVDAYTLEVKDSISSFVKPTLDPIIPQCEIDFTGITQQKIDEHGIEFGDAYAKFKKFIGTTVCYSHGWSRANTAIADGEIWNRGLEFNKIKDSYLIRYKNIADWFREQYARFNIKIEKQSAGDIARLLGRDINIKKTGLSIHNALYDCYSILEGLRFFKEKFNYQFIC